MAQWYAQALLKMMNEEIDFLDDNIRATLHTASYVPNRDTHDYVDDLTSELATSGGYTVGGIALSTKTATVTAANSWGDTWPASTAVEVGYVVRPTVGNGFLYRCVAAGTSGAGEPVWPTVVGKDVTDSGVTWECVGRAILVIDCANMTWGSPFTALDIRYLVISDRTPATAATQPLIGIIDFVTDQDGAGGSFDVVPDTQGLLHLFVG